MQSHLFYQHVIFILLYFFFNDTATTEIYTLSLHDALPISRRDREGDRARFLAPRFLRAEDPHPARSGEIGRSEEHTSELQSRPHLVCRLLLEKKKKQNINNEDATINRGCSRLPRSTITTIY